MFGLLVKVAVTVAGSSAVDAGSIPGSSQLRQKSVVGQEIANSALPVFIFFKIEILIQVLIEPTEQLVFIVFAFRQNHVVSCPGLGGGGGFRVPRLLPPPSGSPTSNKFFYLATRKRD